MRSGRFPYENPDWTGTKIGDVWVQNLLSAPRPKPLKSIVTSGLGSGGMIKPLHHQNFETFNNYL